MEVLWFLKQRTAFIRRHYETAAPPFREIIRKIEAEEAPYEPPYSEDGEPAFMEEWTDTSQSLDFLGSACVSMLSDSLKLYFKTWEDQLGLECQKSKPKEFKKDGFVGGYTECFKDVLKLDWKDCPADLKLIEQIVLARNDAQHHQSITDMAARHSQNTRQKHRLPFFLSEHEKQLIASGPNQGYRWLGVSLVVSEASLFEAIRQVELLCDWMEEPLFGVRYGQK